MYRAGGSREQVKKWKNADYHSRCNFLRSVGILIDFHAPLISVQGSQTQTPFFRQ